MKKQLPKYISVLDAAKALRCSTGIIYLRMGIRPVTGLETVNVKALAEIFKVPLEILAGLIAGHDRALTKGQAAQLLGIKKHCLNLARPQSATVVPVVNLGQGRGIGFRYSMKAIEAHLALKSAA